MPIQTKILFLVAMLLGTAPRHANTPTGGEQSLSIQLDQPRSLLLERVAYRRTANGIEVSGRVAKRGERRGRILGHVNITLMDALGQTLAHL